MPKKTTQKAPDNRLFDTGKWFRCALSKRPIEKQWRKVAHPCKRVALRHHAAADKPVALVPGSMNLVVIDIDIKPCNEHSRSPKGILTKLVKVLGDPLCSYKTKSGGIHALYNWSGKWKGGGDKRGQMRWKYGDVIGGDAAYFIVWDIQTFADRTKGETLKHADLSKLPQDDDSPKWKPGTRNNQFNEAIFNAFIEGRKSDIPKLTAKAEKSGLTQSEIQATLKSATKAAKKARKATGNKLILPQSEEGLRRALSAVDIDVRYNLRSGMPEWKRSNETEWLQFDDRSEAAIRERISKLIVNKSSRGKMPWRLADQTWRTYLNAVLFHHEIDSLIVDYFDTLTPAASPILDTWLHSLFKFDTDDKLVRVMARAIVIGIVERTFEPGHQIRDFPLFIGPPKVGKSKMAEFLMPSPRLFGDDLDFRDISQKQLEAIQGKAVVELAELQGITPRTAQKVKAYITREIDDSVRKAYRRNAEYEPRRVFFIGTANPDSAELPLDEGLLDRFVLLEVKKENGPKGHVKKWLIKHRSELFSAGIHAYQAGARHIAIPDKLKSKSAKAILNFALDPDIDLRDKIQDTLGSRTEILTNRLIDRLGLFGDEEKRVPALMRQLGFKRYRKSKRVGGKLETRRGWQK